MNLSELSLNETEKVQGKRNISEILVTIASITLFSSYYIFESFSWGRYVFFAAVLFILAVMLVRDKGKLYLSIQPWHIFIGVLCLFIISSVLWAFDPADPIQEFSTLVQIFLCTAVLYMYYQSGDNTARLFNIVKWSGYIVSVYSIFYYGVSYLITMLESDKRIGNGFSNINSISTLGVIAILIELYEMQQKRKLKLSAFLCIPVLFIIIVMESKKAFIMLLLGVVMLLFLGNKDKDSRKMLIKWALALGVVLLGCYLLMNLPLFEGIRKRFELFFSTLSGGTQTDGSSELRMEYIKIGFNAFKKHPIGGVGYGCPHILAYEFANENTYLHNNYIELLAGGGIIGFLIYYSMYIYNFAKLYRYRRIEHNEKLLCFVLLTLFAVTEIGVVNCYLKQTYFYFMIFFLELNELKKLDEKEQ